MLQGLVEVQEKEEAVVWIRGVPQSRVLWIGYEMSQQKLMWEMMQESLEVT